MNLDLVCDKCHLPHAHCLCGWFTPVPAQTRIVLVMHFKELYRLSNTARLVNMMVAGAQLRVRGQRSPVAPPRAAGSPPVVEPRPRGALLDDLDLSQACVLFPSDDAIPLAQWRALHPDYAVTLVVPDGNWGQTRRAVRREPELAALPRVVLSEPRPATIRLRNYPDPFLLCTLEAVARALGELEGPDVEQRVMAMFWAWLKHSGLYRGGRM